ncbi:MAG: hypothetical protein R2747_25015 [Pyrinomonadaceae bacterium]
MMRNVQISAAGNWEQSFVFFHINKTFTTIVILRINQRAKLFYNTVAPIYLNAKVRLDKIFAKVLEKYTPFSDARQKNPGLSRGALLFPAKRRWYIFLLRIFYFIYNFLAI